MNLSERQFLVMIGHVLFVCLSLIVVCAELCLKQGKACVAPFVSKAAEKTQRQTASDFGFCVSDDAMAICSDNVSK
jgi:hypothetical protein